MKLLLALCCLLGIGGPAHAADNQLTEQEKQEGWLLLFDGKSLSGWKTSNEQPGRRPVEQNAINPHKCGGYMIIHERPWSDFILALDFKIARGCNSGVFVRTFPLTPRARKDVGYNGLEVAIDDTTTADYHDTGAIYDLVKPRKAANRPAGEWNHLQITCDKSRISVALNDVQVAEMDLDQWKEKNKRPDGTSHKFDVVFKDHPRQGFIGLQDHGGECWFKNIKLKPLAP